MDKKVADEKNRYSNCKQPLEVARPHQRKAQQSPNHNTKKREQQEHPKEPPLFCKGRENEVGLILGEELQLALRAVADALSPDLTRADRDGRLVGIVPRALDVRERIEKGHDARLLVLLKGELPETAKS